MLVRSRAVALSAFTPPRCGPAGARAQRTRCRYTRRCRHRDGVAAARRPRRPGARRRAGPVVPERQRHHRRRCSDRRRDARQPDQRLRHARRRRARCTTRLGPLRRTGPPSRSLADAIPRGVLAPDGCVLDAAGLPWVADALHGRCVRVREGGEIVAEIRTPMGVFACVLGGSDGRTLFLCSAADFAEPTRRAAREVTTPAAAGRRGRQ